MLAHAQVEGALAALQAIGEGCVKSDDFARRGVDCLQRLAASELTTLSVCNLDDGSPRLDGGEGQVVVTVFSAHYPMVRFGTGDLSAFERELRQEFCCHPFAFYHHPLHQQRQVYRLLIAAQHLWQTHRQVVIASMRCCQEWMSLSIV